MNKKFLSAVLFGALMVTSTGTFVSCKDYDDDIDQINKELTDIKSAISELQKKVGDGKFVTNVVKEGEGIKITWNDNSTSTIETIKGADGKDGKNGTVVTIIDGFWAFDGVKSAYPAKGDKGETGEDGAAAAAGHDAKISEDGYWMVWDTTLNGGEGAYKKTEYIAGGATAVAGAHGWTINVRDDKGQMQSIYVPNSADLVSIAPALGELEDNCAFNIYYGILNSDVEWKGHKAVTEKMEAGMYPTLDRDVQMMLNPTGVDGSAYKFEFKASDNAELWGLKLQGAEPYAGGKLTRDASASGVWTLPCDIEHVTLNELNERADYVTQFKKNDNQYYAFALSATSTEEPSKVIKSQYIYTLKPINVGNIEASKFGWNGSVDLQKTYYVWNKNHKPNFEAYTYQQASTQWLGLDLSQVIYDYKLEIDETKMSPVLINKYGLKISEDGYTFNATKEAAVDNWVYLKLSYILVNGSKTTTDLAVRIVAKEIVDVNNNIGSINEKFNANLVTAADAPFAALAGKYVFAKELSFNLTDKLAGNYDEWVDAMYNGLSARSSNASRAEFLKEAAVLTGGDPINNSADYNEGLLRHFIYFDYVDVNGKSCVYDVTNDKLMASIKNIAALKVRFVAGTALYRNSAWTVANSTPVKAPYYTVSGNQTSTWNTSDGYALPLNNAFRIQLAVAKEQQTVAGFNFTFQLTMPNNCPIKRQSVGNQTTAWSVNEDGVDVLKVYGEKQGREAMAADLRDAFIGVYNFQNGAYNDDSNVEGHWYDLQVPTNSFMLIGQSNEAKVTLANISPSSVYTEWNTRGFFLNGNLDEYTLTNIKYHHFNVYTEKQGDIILKFASKVADSKQASCNGTKANPLVAGAVYNADKTLNHYEFTVANGNFTMKDAFNNAYYLFDDSDKFRANKHVKLLEDRQGIAIDKAAPSYYGLYPSAKVDGQATSLVTYTLDKTGATDKTTKMTMTIDKSSGVDKVFEITYNVTDVFGCVKPVTFYVRTVNEAIGNDDKK